MSDIQSFHFHIRLGKGKDYQGAFEGTTQEEAKKKFDAWVEEQEALANKPVEKKTVVVDKQPAKK